MIFCEPAIKCEGQNELEIEGQVKKKKKIIPGNFSDKSPNVKVLIFCMNEIIH